MSENRFKHLGQTERHTNKVPQLKYIQPSPIYAGVSLSLAKTEWVGVVLQSDMKWTSNTEQIVKRASNKLWIIRGLKGLVAQTAELVDIFIKQCRSILELAVPAWHGAITLEERPDIERGKGCRKWPSI